MKKLRSFFSNEYVLIFIFCFAVMLGPALSTLVNCKATQICGDAGNYIHIARFELNQKTVVRRYRIIVPMIASALNSIFQFSFKKSFSPTFEGDPALAVSFFVINILIMSLYGTVIYRCCKAYANSFLACLTGILVMLTSWRTSYWAALPLSDAFYCLMVGATLLAIKTKNTKLLLLCIFLGPFAKESYFFFTPLIFFFAHLPKKQLLLYITLSVIAVLIYRKIFDALVGAPSASIYSGVVMRHVGALKNRALPFFSKYGLYCMLSTIGAWIFLPIIGAISVPGFFKRIYEKTDRAMWLFLAITFFHILFGTYPRHMYIAMPALCVLAALNLDLLKSNLKISPTREL